VILLVVIGLALCGAGLVYLLFALADPGRF